MKRTKLIFTATLALGLLFCVNDATAQQAVKKVETQKTVQTQNNEQAKSATAQMKTYNYKGKTVLIVPSTMKLDMNMNTAVPKPQLITKPRQD